MAEVTSLNKQHPLYQEDLARIAQTPGIEGVYGKTFLISGATGLIGVCLIDALMYLNKQGAGITIYALGRSCEKAAQRLGEYFEDSHFHFVEREASESLLELPKVDVIIPLASNTHPLAYSKYPIETININVKGAEQALEKAVACGAMVLYPSTVEVYGNARGDDDFTEDYTGQLNLATARACYTESKRLSEALCQSYIAERGAQVKIVRLSRVFGPTMLMSDSKASSQFLQKALAGEDIVLKSKGEQLFSYTYMADAVGAMLHVLLHGEEGVAYNIANEACNVRLKDFAQLCAAWANKQVVFELPSETEQKGFSIAMRAVLDNTRLKGLGWKPQYTMKDAVCRTLSILSHE
jgi:nucleoside-diphosphate-sugar epimerase